MTLIAGQFIQHFKGGFYRILHFATDAETNEPVVVYISLKDGQIWTRPETEFHDAVEWPDGVTRRRFICNIPPGVT